MQTITKKIKISTLLTAIILTLNLSQSLALSPEKRLTNQTQEEQAQKIFKQIRCLVCEAQSIASSNTEFSSQMRKVIRNKISQGKNEDQIKGELRKEFGEEIFMSPDFLSENDDPRRILWFLPLVFALFIGWFLFFRRGLGG